MTWTLFFSALWALTLLGAYLKLPKLLAGKGVFGRHPWLAVAMVAFVARMVPNLVLAIGAQYDIGSYQIVADLLLGDGQVYDITGPLKRHPYLPFQMYWMAFARWGASAVHVPFVKVVRLAPIAADVAIALVLGLSLRRFGLQAALRGGLAYALNPVPIFVSAYHGQFDAIPALFILLAIYTLSQSSLVSGWWLGLGILSKSWPILAFPSLFVKTRGWTRRLLFATMTLLVPLVSLALYIQLFGEDAITILRPVLSYNWGVGVWGYPYLARLLSILKPESVGLIHWLQTYGRFLTLAGLGIVWLIRARREPPGSSVLTILVGFFAITHAFSIQYLMWIVPFAILQRDYRWLTRYTLGAFAYMFLVYMTLILTTSITHLLPLPEADWFIIIPAGLPAWLVTVGWLAQRLAGAREPQNCA